MIELRTSLGEVATTQPGATAVFLRHGLDFCCGGAQPLDEACRAAGLDAAEIAAEIAAESTPTVGERWDTRPLSELIDHILTRYHAAHRRDVPGLIEAARKVERVHAQKPTCPNGLATFLTQLQDELASHMGKEEVVLFPAILSGARGSSVHMPIRVMLKEHVDHGDNLQRLRALTNDFEPPKEACATWRALYQALHKLSDELMEHIHLENNVLFPRALGD